MAGFRVVGSTGGLAGGVGTDEKPRPLLLGMRRSLAAARGLRDGGWGKEGHRGEGSGQACVVFEAG
ncbi:hypothetical protein Aglo01_47700 [Actinokineospora globicatena]|nr:hypothetical protein Aglo01_47700 [Actinokineospora globicatena]GLW87117.1 hypothetical protein Aglo02_47560 [Actinokineospora globicatena]